MNSDDLEHLTTVLEGHISDYVRDADSPHDPTGITAAAAYVQIANVAMNGLHNVKVSDAELQKVIRQCLKDMIGGLAAISFVLMVAKFATLKDKGVDE